MKLTPEELADQFSNLNKADFQKFWMHVLFLWNDEESDLDEQWFYYSQGAACDWNRHQRDALGGLFWD